MGYRYHAGARCLDADISRTSTGSVNGRQVLASVPSVITRLALMPGHGFGGVGIRPDPGSNPVRRAILVLRITVVDCALNGVFDQFRCRLVSLARRRSSRREGTMRISPTGAARRPQVYP